MTETQQPFEVIGEQPEEPVPTPPEPKINKYFQATDSMGKALMRALVDHIKLMPDQWHKLSEQKQQDLLDSMGDSVHSLVKETAQRFMAVGFPSVGVILQQITLKQDGIKGTILIERTDNGIDALSHQAGRQLVLVLTSPELYSAGVDEFEPDPDQPGLPLEEPRPVSGGFVPTKTASQIDQELAARATQRLAELDDEEDSDE